MTILPDGPVPAGEFSAWLDGARDNLRTRVGASVPCGQCSACCRSSQFVHIEPDETATLARIPKELLFPAPGKPPGTMVMGYDRNGHCPMLTDDQCSIYDDRPRTCRNYDCRVFAAAGLQPSEDSKGLISERTQRWQFDYPAARDRAEHAAVRAAAAFLREHAGDFPGGLPNNPAQLALLAIKAYEVFLRRRELSELDQQMSVSEIIEAIVESNRQFETSSRSIASRDEPDSVA